MKVLALTYKVCDILQKVYSLLGFTQKAGQLSAGNEAVKASLSNGKASLLIISNDIADNSKKELLSISQSANIPHIVMGSKYELGLSIGKAYRVAVTINNKKMATAILKAFQWTGEKRETMGVVEWPK